MRILAFLISILTTSHVQSQGVLDLSTLPDRLKENAGVVVRSRNVEFTINSISRATYKSHEIVTILNSRGKQEAIKTLYYDGLTKINSLSATVYRRDGTKIKKYQENDFQDQSAISGFSLYEDNRVKTLDLSQGEYPYTIDFEFSLDFKYLFQIPTFYPIWMENMSVENSSFTLNFQTDNKPHILLRNIDMEATEMSKSDTHFTWYFTNLQPIAYEEHGQTFGEMLPSIRSAPLNFEYEGYKGKMNSWEEFGSWIHGLNEGRDGLSQETVDKIRELTRGLNNSEDKVKALYKFMQERTRYVSIQLGIGGFQPYDARTVDAVGYGDCKALSNYMVALLKEAGIESYYTLIRAGDKVEPMQTEFPSNQFNHVIVFVPNGVDSIWLECTSQKTPFNYLGSFTSDRNALAILHNGAAIVRTPKIQGNSSLKATTRIKISEGGKASVVNRSTYEGQQSEKHDLNFIVHASEEDQRKWFERNLQFPSYKLNDYKFFFSEDEPTKITTEVDIEVDRFASLSGKRIFITPNAMNRMPIVYKTMEHRKTAFIIHQSQFEIDSIEYLLPENYYPEYQPNNQTLQSQYGEYDITFTFSENKLIYVRKLLLHKGIFSAEYYDELARFNREITSADKQRVVFVNKT